VLIVGGGHLADRRSLRMAVAAGLLRSSLLDDREDSCPGRDIRIRRPSRKWPSSFACRIKKGCRKRFSNLRRRGKQGLGQPDEEPWAARTQFPRPLHRMIGQAAGKRGHSCSTTFRTSGHSGVSRLAWRRACADRIEIGAETPRSRDQHSGEDYSSAGESFGAGPAGQMAAEDRLRGRRRRGGQSSAVSGPVRHGRNTPPARFTL